MSCAVQISLMASKFFQRGYCRGTAASGQQIIGSKRAFAPTRWSRAISTASINGAGRHADQPIIAAFNAITGRPPPVRSNRLARFNDHIGRKPVDVLRPAQFGASDSKGLPHRPQQPDGNHPPARRPKRNCLACGGYRRPAPGRMLDVSVSAWSYASFKACAMSAIRSDGCSIPIDSRMVESSTPIF